jgi:hypothetical protein
MLFLAGMGVARGEMKALIPVQMSGNKILIQLSANIR